MTKILLVASLAGMGSGFIFVTGLVSVGKLVALYIALPLGAVLFGLFLIAKVLEGEVARYEGEQKRTQSVPVQSKAEEEARCSCGCSEHAEAR